jgi:hypothetical protein
LFVHGLNLAADGLESANAGAEVWSCDDVWQLLIEERPPLNSIWDVYGEAIHNIILGREGVSSSVPF